MTSSLFLIDHALVKVKDKETEDLKQRESGLFVVSNEASKAPSFGTLVQAPGQIISDKYRSLRPLLEEGVVIHFSTRRGYDPLPLEDPGFVYLFIPVDAITAIDLGDRDGSNLLAWSNEH